ncbi:MAG: hypothetical protein DRJ03_00720 [Chloroflexi bacterium]|nr:MAG: hypothetical protein DRJ03_00720 [Chloroflexota bacterium]
MSKFVVRKNTLPYVHQWAMIDTDTGGKVGEYKTRKLAEKACSGFEKYGIPEDAHGTPPGFENAWNAVSKRMKRPGGDPLPKPPKRKRKHSDKRRVELD